MTPRTDTARALYFRTLERVSGVLAGFSEGTSAETFSRLRNLFRLIDLRTAAGDPPKTDRINSGFPILKEVVSIANDRKHGLPGNPTADPERLRTDMLDQMLARRRLPSPHMIAEMARAVYAAALNQDPDIVFMSDVRNSHSWMKAGNAYWMWWDHWDGPTSRPVRCAAVFDVNSDDVHNKDRLEPAIVRVAEIAAAYTGIGFLLSTLAGEIDEGVEDLRLKSLKRVAVGPFVSPVFSEIEDPIAGLVADADDLDDAWALRWVIETIVSAGTTRVAGGFFSRARTREKFVITKRDPACESRGITEFESNIAMPHGIYQRVSDSSERRTLLAGSRPCVVTPAGRLIENV